MRYRLLLPVIVLGLLCMAQLSGPSVTSSRRPHVRVPDFAEPPHDWVQFDFDVRHSGTNSDETDLGPENVADLQLIFQKPLGGVSDGAPILWANESRLRSNHYLFFTATNGTLIATDGDGNARWRTEAPAGPRWTTSSPVLDPGREFVYSYALDGRVHKYMTLTGQEVRSGGWPVVVTLKPDVEKVSAALSVATTPGGVSFLYATVAGYPDPGDAGDYQGHIVAIRLQDARATTFNVLCSHRNTVLGYGDCKSVQAGVWGRPGAIYNESDNSIYVVTSNGPYTGNSGGSNWGNSILRLFPDGRSHRGRPIDSYTPAEFDTLDKQDLDLGSSGLALVARPGENVPTLGVHAGKDSIIRVVDLKDLSGQGAAGFVGGELQRLNLPQGGYNMASPAVWLDRDNNSWIYFVNNRGVSALEMMGTAQSPQLVERWRVSDVSANSSPVVANGVVFIAKTGRITALDALTGEELWFDTRVGQLHWQSPIVVNGAVYITDLGGMLTAYSLPKKLFGR